jgi:hypothetical protein
MSKAAKATMVVVALFVSGGILATNVSPVSSTKASAVTVTWNSGSNASFDLGANVDWSKVKQEPMSPTF